MAAGKKIIRSIIEGGAEFVKESAGQMAETVDPVKLIEQTTGTHSASHEFSDYLKNLVGNLSESEIEKKRQEFEKEQKTVLEEAEKVIKSALPAHLKPAVPAKKPSVYEQNIRDEEMKKAKAVEAQKQQKKAIVVPTGIRRGILGGLKRKKPRSTDLEVGKNIKTG